MTPSILPPGLAGSRSEGDATARGAGETRDPSSGSTHMVMLKLLRNQDILWLKGLNMVSEWIEDDRSIESLQSSDCNRQTIRRQKPKGISAQNSNRGFGV